MKTEQNIIELERIVAERQDWLFRFAYMRIGRREDAEDLVQEVLLKLFKAMQRSGGVDDVERYLGVPVMGMIPDSESVDIAKEKR